MIENEINLLTGVTRIQIAAKNEKSKNFKNQKIEF